MHYCTPFHLQGEICLCGSRIFVYRSIYPVFLQRFIAETRRLVVGDPRSASTTTGALVSREHLDKVLSYVQLAPSEGGEVVCGGKRLTGLCGEDGRDLSAGYFMEPTIIASERSDGSTRMDPMTCRVMQEEIFGPVVTVTPFDSEAEVITWANGTRYGLAATVWTENGRRQRRVAEQLRAGTVWVNCWMVRDLGMPFGGMGMSGVGREGGDYSLKYFTEEKTVCLAN